MAQSKPATSSQLNLLLSWYQWNIGYSNTCWYINKLKQQGFTSLEASKEIRRLHALKIAGKTNQMIPVDWEEVKPSSKELEVFLGIKS